MPYRLDADSTKIQIRELFERWKIDRLDWDLDRQRDEYGRPMNGVTVRYKRTDGRGNGEWQIVRSFNLREYAQNLRACFMILDALRKAERDGVQYQGLTSSKEVATTNQAKSQNVALAEAYDIMGVMVDDPTELIEKLYKVKCQTYHPDHGGSADKFKRITEAYQTIMKSRGKTP